MNTEDLQAKGDRRIELEDIKKYWVRAGQQFSNKGSVTSTSRDPFLGQLEEDNILSHLKKRQIVLEMGCGDASHTVKYSKHVAKLFGVDVAESLINIAKRRANSEGIDNINFTVASILNLKKIFKAMQFNCIISQRCLINLPEWKWQQDAILQAYDLIQTDGLFLISEGFQEELDNLNNVRQNLGLPRINVVSYNRNLIRRDFEAFIHQYFDIVEVRHYAVYLFLSRIFHPLVTLPHEPKHDSKMNEVAKEVSRIVQFPDLEKYSYNLFYVLQKR